MATYAIGDLQGCYDSLMQLLDKIQFTPEQDTLWLAGDLVCRGPQSLETLRFVRSLGNRAVSVLGNHDISLIASHYGLFKAHRSLLPIMQAKDREDIIDWLRHRPLLHVNEKLDHCMAHAGISPAWDLSTAISCANEVESILQGDSDELTQWFKYIYQNKPLHWSDTLSGYKRHRYIINSFTRMRFCNQQRKLNFKQKQSPKVVQQEKPHLVPWFRVETRKQIHLKIVFGHWSTLGFYQDDNVIALDTGCVWNGKLTAYQIEPSEGEMKHSIQCNN